MLHSISRRGICGKQYLRVLSGLVKELPLRNNVYTVSGPLCSPSNRDLPTPAQLTPVSKLYSSDTDILLEQIKNAKSVERVLEMVSMHLEVMNDNHISWCFKIIYNNLNERDLLFQGNKLIDDVLFQSLCSRLMDRSRYLEPDDLITAFKTLTKLKVPSNTYVIQVMLKMICSRINELSLNQLTFINFLLAKHRPTALTDSLKLALPLVLQVQIDQQLDSDNISEVVSCLQMACKARLKPATIEKVISHLQRKVPEFTATHAADVIFGLFSFNAPVDGYMRLINSCFDIITTNIDQLNQSALLAIARISVKKSFCHPAFFMRLCKRSVSEYWPLDSCYELCFRMRRSGFFSPEIIHLFAERIQQNREYVQTSTKHSLFEISECFAFADYSCTKFKEVYDVVLSSTAKLDELRKHYPDFYVGIMSCWSILGFLPNNDVRNILEENFLNSAWSFSRNNGRSYSFQLNVCCLQWALEVYDEYEHYKLPKQFMKKIYQSVQQSHIKSSKFPLTKFIENGLGGPQFCMNAVLTQNGHVLDHVIAMRSGNYPVSFAHESNSGQQFQHLEDVRVPDDAKIIAVIVASNDDYCIGPEFFRGYMGMKIKSLSKMSLHPVVINYDLWITLPDKEKIPFLMREIKGAGESEYFSKSTVSTS